jgi:hypothetical protein
MSKFEKTAVKLNISKVSATASCCSTAEVHVSESSNGFFFVQCPDILTLKLSAN